MAEATLAPSGHQITLKTWEEVYDNLADCVDVNDIDDAAARADYPSFVLRMDEDLTTIRSQLEAIEPHCGVDDIVIDLPVDLRFKTEIDGCIEFVKDNREEFKMDFAFTARLLAQKDGEKTISDLHKVMRNEDAAREAGFTAPAEA